MEPPRGGRARTEPGATVQTALNVVLAAGRHTVQLRQLQLLSVYVDRQRKYGYQTPAEPFECNPVPIAISTDRVGGNTAKRIC